jgi:hypothetical protein
MTSHFLMLPIQTYKSRAKEGMQKKDRHPQGTSHHERAIPVARSYITLRFSLTALPRESIFK